MLYTNPEDDWSDLGLDKEEDEDTQDRSSSSPSSSSALNAKEQKMLLQKNNSNKLKSQYHSSYSPPTIKEDEEEMSNVSGEYTSNKYSVTSSIDLGPKVQNWTEVIRNDAPKRTISSPMVTYTQKEAENSIGYGNADNGPQVRRKSSELSQSMKTRLEAFNSSTQAAGGTEGEQKEIQKTTVEPDGQFKQKLQTFRKISEGNLNQTETERKPKPPMTISSLLGGGVSLYLIARKSRFINCE